jgi:indole-3-glycerol phosphate synthase
MLKVAESGIETPEDLVRLRDAGYDGALVGERLVTDPDPAEALRRLREGTA